MRSPFNWQNSEYGGFRAEMPENVTLCATPDRTTGFGARPARGTTWRAQASHWCESTRTISRFGRDAYGVQHKTAKDAMRAAEQIYLDATVPA